MAFSIEAARHALQRGGAPGSDLRELFTSALAQTIRTAVRPFGGDPAFQALVLKAQSRDVEAYVGLSAKAAADRRALSAAVGAMAHPGKLRSRQEGSTRDALALLHRLATAGDWVELKRATDRLLEQELAAQDRLGLQALQQHPSLERLARGMALSTLDVVARYRALCEQRGPLSGSGEAAARGAAAGRRGAATETSAVRALRGVADVLNRCAPLPARHRVVSGLLVPSGFPGSAERAKSEWDAAIVRMADAGPTAEVVLLVEAKASAEAAAADLSRLIRGLQRLAQADTEAAYVFPSSDGELHVTGRSLRRLAPCGRSLPPQVIYCCDASAESQVSMLSAAAKGLLLAQPACLAFAARLTGNGAPGAETLDPVWEDLTREPQSRRILHQYESARTAREAMLHPQDLLSAAEALWPTCPDRE